MNADCRRIDEALAGGRPLNDDELAHAASCDRCKRVTEALDRLDEDLTNLRPPTPDSLAERVSTAVAEAGPEQPRLAVARVLLTRRGLVAAATFILVTVVASSMYQLRMSSLGARAHGGSRAASTTSAEFDRERPAGQAELQPAQQVSSEPGLPEWESDRFDVGRSGDREPASLELQSQDEVGGYDAAQRRKAKQEQKRSLAAKRARSKAEADRMSGPSAERERLARLESDARRPASAPAPSPVRVLNARLAPIEEDLLAANEPLRTGLGHDIVFSTGSFVAYPPGSRETGDTSDFELITADGSRAEHGERGGAILDISEGAIRDFKLITGGFQAEYGEQSTGIADIVDEAKLTTEADTRILNETKGYLGDRVEGFGADVDGGADKNRLLLGGKAQGVDGRGDLLAQMGYGALGYESADWQGISLDRPVYFENTYLGGNARLAWLDRLATPLRLGHELVAPHRAVSWPDLPFDAPERGAVSLHVDASEIHVPAGEKRRVFLQVGIAGTENAAWRRPPASVVLLPLLSDASAAELTRAVETLRSGLESRDLVAVASASGGLVFGAPTARDGDLSGVAPDEARSLLRRLAGEFRGVETGASLRTRRLVILSDRPVGEDLRRQVHRLALKDVVTSVVSLGRPSDRTLEAHARIAQAGQGNLHFADGAMAVVAAISDELDSLTRVVARALRLNIRPAQGVRLIQVLGSRPLGRREVKEVKAREKAVDRAVERSTGIASDRGADDPGLQTVLPYFLAGDRHVVIIELEVNGPGPLADVSLRLKDLIEMENRSLRASVALSRNPAERSPRQQQVRRNVVGFAVAKILHETQDALASGGSAQPERLRSLAQRLLDDPLLASQADALLLQTYARILVESSDRSAIVASLESARLARLGRGKPTEVSR